MLHPLSPDSTNATLAARYDAIAYPALPHPLTHPDRLATVATFLGASPPEVAQCRVLEVGCNDGGNLIPMAVALPSATFIGCDLSPFAIAAGTPIDGIYLSRRQLVQLMFEPLADVTGRSLGALEAAA